MPDKKQIIVSLTSFPAVLPLAIQAIQSILNGSVLPDKIVLYLTYSQFVDNSIPVELQNLVDSSPIFEIRYCNDDIRSYTKLVPALADFPDAVIVTVDDDVRYNKNMLEVLLRFHDKIPDAILAHRAKRVRTDAPYRKWKKFRWYNFVTKRIHSSFKNLQTGVGGVLYPPNSLKKEMIDSALFKEMAPTMDDIWFWAAAVANGTKIIPVPFGYNKPHDLNKPMNLSLKTINFKTGDDLNSKSLKKILERYPIIHERLESEK